MSHSTDIILEPSTTAVTFTGGSSSQVTVTHAITEVTLEDGSTTQLISGVVIDNRLYYDLAFAAAQEYSDDLVTPIVSSLSTVSSGLSTLTSSVALISSGLSDTNTAVSAISSSLSDTGATVSTIVSALGDKADLVGGLVPASQLPSFLDDVLEGTYVNTTTFHDEDGDPYTPEPNKVYIDTTFNKSYRWSGSLYAPLDEGAVLGETSSTAYRGDRGKTAYDHSQTTGNPHGTTTADISGLDTTLTNKVDKIAGKGLSTEDYSTAEKGKLSGIAVGATANQTDAYLLDRTNHTGTQAASTITGTAVTLNALNVFTKSQIVAPVINNTATGTVTPDMSASNNFQYLVTGNLTIANPSPAATNFQNGLFRLKQGGSGSYTIAFDTKFKFKASPVFSTAVGAVDYVSYIYNSTDDRYDCLLNAGF